MRVMVLLKANEQSEAGVLPSEQLIADMQRFNEELAHAGVMLAGEGLQPSSKGARVELSPAGGTVRHGPFDTRELIAGFWLWQVPSLEEAIDWVKRIPLGERDEEQRSVVEIRPIYEIEDFGERLTPELRERQEKLRQEAAARR